MSRRFRGMNPTVTIATSLRDKRQLADVALILVFDEPCVFQPVA